MIPGETMGGALERVMAGLSKMEKAAVLAFEYSTLAADLTDLRSAVEQAITDDQKSANSFWTDLSRVLSHGLNFVAEKRRFDDQAHALVAKVNAALTNVESVCRHKLEPKAEAPKNLENDAKLWLAESVEVDAKRRSCERLQVVEGWTGEASERYGSAVLVQVSALTELSGVLTSTAQSCQTGANLNRAIFAAADKAIKRSTGIIRRTRVGGGSAHYVRCAQTLPELDQLLTQIHSAINGEVTAGSERELSHEMIRTLSMPNVLTPGRWPTGTGAHGVPPAATDRGVTNDGSDADINVDRGPGYCAPGVNL